MKFCDVTRNKVNYNQFITSLRFYITETKKALISFSNNDLNNYLNC